MHQFKESWANWKTNMSSNFALYRAALQSFQDLQLKLPYKTRCVDLGNIHSRRKPPREDCMRISYILLLEVVAIVVNLAVVHSEQAPISKTNVIEPNVDKNEPFTTRKLLRSQGAVDVEESDRVDNENDLSERTLPGVSKLAKLASKLRVLRKMENLLWLTARENPKNVFKKLKLHEAGEKIGDTPQLLQWLKYVQAYRKKMDDDFAFANY